MTDDAVRPRLARALSRVVPLILIAAMPAAVSFASSGGTGPGGGGTDTSSGTSAKYERIWKGFSKRNKRWARRTSDCESGGDRKIHGGGGSFHGAFQFMKETWRNSPKSPGGDPHRYSWRTQAVVAVLLKKRDGAGHWPVCG